MKKLLAIESTGPVCAVAMLDIDTGETLANRELEELHVHSKVLAPWVDEVIEEHGNPHAVAVSKGPGSYTGLRIGVSLAKGLSYGLNVPLIGVSTLAAMAAGYLGSNQTHPQAIIQPMIDARRMEVFTQAFDANGEPITEISNVILDEEWEKPSRPWVPLGDGAQKVTRLEKFKDVGINNDTWLSAISVGKLALKDWQRGNFEEIHRFEPYYHKSFRAGSPKRFFQFLAND